MIDGCWRRSISYVLGCNGDRKELLESCFYKGKDEVEQGCYLPNKQTFSEGLSRRRRRRRLRVTLTLFFHPLHPNRHFQLGSVQFALDLSSWSFFRSSRSQVAIVSRLWNLRETLFTVSDSRGGTFFQRGCPSLVLLVILKKVGHPRAAKRSTSPRWRNDSTTLEMWKN